MSPASKINQSSPSEADLPGSPNSPTTPGVYWFQNETMSKAVMVEVRMTKVQLMVWWLTREDEPVAELRGRWQGPIAPSTGPGSQ
jgi:hypothetical protein